MGPISTIIGGLICVLALIPSLHATDEIYSDGPLGVVFLNASARGFSASPECKTASTGPSRAGRAPPRDLFIAVPNTPGQYPVIQLQHGFAMVTSFYTQLLQHVASHGFIIVAPQMSSNLASRDATPDIARAASVIDWHQNNLAATIKRLIPTSSIVPDLNKFVLLGHSRGGKVAFGLATGVCKTSVKYSAVIGFDPVDGNGTNQQTPPPILTNKPLGLNLTFPTLIVGAGLGPQSLPGLPSCAPEGVSHDAFFLDSNALAFHFVAPTYGHMDYLDDNTDGVLGIATRFACRNGPSRAPLRQFSGGILIAFLKAVLNNDYRAIANAIANPTEAPVPLNPPQLTGVLPDSQNSLVSLLQLKVSQK